MRTYCRVASYLVLSELIDPRKSNSIHSKIGPMTYSILFSSHRLLKVLECMALISIILAFVRPRLGAIWFNRIERHLRQISKSAVRSIVIAALLPLAVRIVMLPWYPPPPPQIHDEFSYLLQGDTFAHGRVANPTPPYWEHFETEYTLFHPSYASQYQPAQGLALALGRVVFGHPWWGVWLSIGLMCGTICWALRGIVPPVWALAGALGTALQIGIFGLWMNSYFGGAMAAAAGALVLGSIARLRKGMRVRQSGAICGIGIILLFATRPFEALLWSGVAGLFAFWDIFHNRQWKVYAPALLSFTGVFLVGVSFLAWYNWRITHDPLRPPYLVYQKEYGTPQPYWWQSPVRVASFRFPEIRDNYLNQLNLYEMRHSLPQILTAEKRRLINFWRFFVGPFLSPALAFILYLRRDRRIWPWLLASIPFIIDKATYHAWYPSQNAPATILIVLVILQAWRHLHAWSRHRGVGVAMTRYLTAAFCLAIVFGGLGRAVEPLLPSRQLARLAPIWESLYPARRLRDDVTKLLESKPGSHLVFVKYAPNHCFCEEWVFNDADIKNQKVVYVRPYTPESDIGLAQYLADHDLWVIEPDERPYRLKPLTLAELATISEQRETASVATIAPAAP